MVDGETLKRILSAVAEEAKAVFAEKLESVILYGSYARGDADDEEDELYQAWNKAVQSIPFGKIDPLQ